MSNSKFETLFDSAMGTSPDPRLTSISSNHMEPKTMLIYDDYDSERVSRDYLGEEKLSSSSLDALISNVGGEIKRVEVLMPYRILLKKKVRPNLKMRECAKSYIQLRLRTDN